MRVIKKYRNRRLYDTQASTYINLVELADLIRSGDDVRVVSVSDGSDLTRAVLLQVLLEVQGGAEILPTALLHRVIRLSDPGPSTPPPANESAPPPDQDSPAADPGDREERAVLRAHLQALESRLGGHA